MTFWKGRIFKDWKVAVEEEQENNKSSVEDENTKTENSNNEKPARRTGGIRYQPTLVNESHNTLHLRLNKEAQAQAYYAQYAQYMQQYQQYYAQYYPNVSTNSSVTTVNSANFVDPAYDYYSSSGYSAKVLQILPPHSNRSRIPPNDRLLWSHQIPGGSVAGDAGCSAGAEGTAAGPATAKDMGGLKKGKLKEEGERIDGFWINKNIAILNIRWPHILPL